MVTPGDTGKDILNAFKEKGQRFLPRIYINRENILSKDKEKTEEITINQGSEREKDENRGKFIGSNLVIFCYKELQKFALCKSASQSEATFIVYSEPIKNGHVKISCS